jgi:hypothetical protein
MAIQLQPFTTVHHCSLVMSIAFPSASSFATLSHHFLLSPLQKPSRSLIGRFAPLTIHYKLKALGRFWSFRVKELCEQVVKNKQEIRRKRKKIEKFVKKRNKKL